MTSFLRSWTLVFGVSGLLLGLVVTIGAVVGGLFGVLLERRGASSVGPNATVGRTSR